MATSPEMKTSIHPNAAFQAAQEKSWGDRFKDLVYRITRNFLLNYIINFLLSTLITYAVVKYPPGKPEEITPLNRKIRNGIEWVVEKGGKDGLGLPNALVEYVGRFFTLVQILMIGGHFLVWPLGLMHNNRKRLELWYGHALDRLQEALGFGNEASRHNIAEYRRIDTLMDAKPRKAGDVADLSDQDKSLLTKNDIGYGPQFHEKTRSWKDIWKARAGGIVYATGLSILLGILTHFGKKYPEKMGWIDIHAHFETGGKWLGENFLQHVPLLNRLKNISQLGGIWLLEMTSTASSLLGFSLIERGQRKKEKLAEEAAARATSPEEKVAELKRDREFLKQTGIHAQDTQDITHMHVSVPAHKERRKRLEEGGKDFRVRAIANAGAGAKLSIGLS